MFLHPSRARGRRVDYNNCACTPTRAAHSVLLLYTV